MSKGMMVECWKTSFSPSTTAAAAADNGQKYKRVPVPPPHEAGQHFVHRQCCGIPGLVEQYDLYTPISVDGAAAGDTGTSTTHPEVIVAVIRLGRNLGGHPNLLHGGATALVFDDVVGFAADEVLQQGLPKDNHYDRGYGQFTSRFWGGRADGNGGVTPGALVVASGTKDSLCGTNDQCGTNHRICPIQSFVHDSTGVLVDDDEDDIEWTTENVKLDEIHRTENTLFQEFSSRLLTATKVNAKASHQNVSHAVLGA
eukprot:scaffold40250_cov199-Amphora_coffeaeformis.AAC.1